jgi:hypothetical protein
MGLLGEMLVERGALSVEQLQTGLSAHREGKARLGTYLVEYGFIDERSLLETLSEQHGVPFITQPALLECLQGLEQGVMPRSIMEKLRAVPFRRVQGRIQVAMSNPVDANVINSITNHTQMLVEPFVASDRAIKLALEYVKDAVPVATGATDVDLLTDVVGERAGFGWDDLWETRLRPELLLTMHSRPHAAGKLLVATFPGLVPVNSEEGRRKGSRVDNTNLLHQFRAATSAGGIGEILVRYASQRLDRVCLFAVHHGKISGWMGRGLPLDAPDPRLFSVFTEIPSLFWEIEGSDRYLGPIPGGPVDDDLLKIFGSPPPSEILVVALEVKGRTKGYLMGDIPGRRVAETTVDEMVLAAHAASDALTSVLRGRN